MSHHESPGIGTVVPFAGHMVDSPGRAAPRFPPASEALVRGVIDAELARTNARAGVCALASGSDIIFAEALLARGAEVHAVLPLNVEAFLEASVRPSGDDRWEERFHAIRARCTSERIDGDEYLAGSGTPFQLAALMIDGTARRLAAARGWSHAALAVWDGLAGDGLGGTASFVGHCVARSRPVRSIHPLTGAVTAAGAEAIAVAQQHTWRRVGTGPGALHHRLGAVLFADAKGFGATRETQMPAYVRVVTAVVSRAIATLGTAPLVLNTWGDALFAVTDLPADAARLGLALVRESERVNWRAEGLGGRITFRVGLHAGPLFLAPSDPVIGRANAYGREVNLAARIEPAATPGEVWASETFAVLAAATGDDGLAFEPLGVRALAKEGTEVSLMRVGAISSAV